MSTEYRVGITWLKLITFRKGLTLDLFWIFFLDIFLVTFLGYRSIPATRAWLKGLSLVPSSEGFTITAFLPAYLPESSRTTLPPFMIFPMTTSLVEVNQAIKATFGPTPALSDFFAYWGFYHILQNFSKCLI